MTSKKDQNEQGFWIDIWKVKFPRINYDRIAYVLSYMEIPVWMPVGRKTAYYARKRLSKLVGEKITSLPCMWGKRSGYLFFPEKILEPDEDESESEQN